LSGKDIAIRGLADRNREEPISMADLCDRMDDASPPKKRGRYKKQAA